MICSNWIEANIRTRWSIVLIVGVVCSCRALADSSALVCGTIAFAIGWSAPPDAAASAPEEHAPACRTLIIAYAEHLNDVAQEWAAYRASIGTGGAWHIVLHPVAPSNSAGQQRASLQQFIRQTYQDHRSRESGSFAVLLLGDADERGITAWKFPQTDPVLDSGEDHHYASDHPYQLMDDADDVPDIALGRIPAQTLDEARAILNKIKRYEQSPITSCGTGRNRITYAAGEGHFGAMDGVLEWLFKTMVERLVPDSFDLSMTYAKASSIYCPPPSKLTQSVLERMGEGSLLFNYVGHGFAKGLDSLRWGSKRFPILRSSDLKRWSNGPEAQPALCAVAFMSCCSVGWYDLERGERSFAEEMLFHPTGGPLAVIAGSRVTHPYANTVLQMDITRALLVDRAPTAGLLDLMAAQSLVKLDSIDRELDLIADPIARLGRWQTSLMDLRRMHVKLYNLLGDPSMSLSLPAQTITDLRIESGKLTGSVPGMKTGRIIITAETSRTSMVNPAKLQAVLGENDPDLETKAANNYPLANDRVLAWYEGDVIDGRFSISVNNELPIGTSVLRAYATGTDETGNTIDAVGALLIAAARSMQ